NSPFWCGEQTGFASWRHITTRTWPQAGYPPEFADGDEYQHAVQAYVRSGVILDPAMVYWIARLSNRYPTVEFRLADAQLRPSHSVAFAVIVRALVDQAVHDAEDGRPRPLYAP